MTPDLTPAEALEIARFCWPHKDSFWWNDECDQVHGVGGPGPRTWDCNDHSDLSAAERVLVERGLGDEYERALLAQMNVMRAHRIGLSGVPVVEVQAGTIAAAITAPLNVRARSILETVREHSARGNTKENQ